MIAFRFLIAALVLISPLALAESPTIGASGTYILQVFFGLAFVVALIFGMAWMLKRFGQGNLGNNQHMRIISCLSLGAREKIVLLEVGEQQMLVGVTPHQINALEVFGFPVVREEVKDNTDFSRKLMEIMKRGVK